MERGGKGFLPAAQRAGGRSRKAGWAGRVGQVCAGRGCARGGSGVPGQLGNSRDGRSPEAEGKRRQLPTSGGRAERLEPEEAHGEGNGTGEGDRGGWW